MGGWSWSGTPRTPWRPTSARAPIAPWLTRPCWLSSWPPTNPSNKPCCVTPRVAARQYAADRLAQASRLSNPVLRRLRDAGLRRMGKAERWMDRQARSVQQEDPAWLYTAIRTLMDGPDGWRGSIRPEPGTAADAPHPPQRTTTSMYRSP